MPRSSRSSTRPGTTVWSRGFQRAGEQEMSSPRSTSSSQANVVATDVLVADISATLDFDGIPFPSGHNPSSYSARTFLVKLGADGHVLWVEGFDTERPFGIVVDPRDRVLATGTFTGTLDLGSGPLTGTRTPSSRRSVPDHGDHEGEPRGRGARPRGLHPDGGGRRARTGTVRRVRPCPRARPPGHGRSRSVVGRDLPLVAVIAGVGPEHALPLRGDDAPGDGLSERQQDGPVALRDRAR